MFHSNLVQSLRDGKNIELERTRLASLKVEKSRNETMYQFGGNKLWGEGIR
ncbi:hypothetical protein QCI77_10935 [Bacillus cereus group sp. MG9]|uniref:hypothetical protein n=1 Tax=Bacillus cereus group sp. MG9 TaxID=3040247 RepID=UPI003399B8ED